MGVKNKSLSIATICISDFIFFIPTEDQKTFNLFKKVKKNIYYHEIKSLHGHDAFLIESQSMEKILSKIF